ncbi:MAG: hypothetical protein HYY65_10185 [Candidatus Tectomicrobia bacterium]|uniref:Uncharacterized protein n=1 Tax=Tectimicrobiota bacterium TaxID=2528274 RepID=A0A932GQU6_UNCTE|nr:hypothetical protein [Candidatus Tectomicrobia bacterium]
MAEVKQYVFSHKEVVEALVKKQGIHEGIWGLYVEFGIAAANVGPSEDQISPAAIVPIVKLGIQRFDQENNLSVDASKVNPSPRKSTPPKSKK